MLKFVSDEETPEDETKPTDEETPESSTAPADKNKTVTQNTARTVKTDRSIKTGDHGFAGFWIALTGLAAAAIALLYRFRRNAGA